MRLGASGSLLGFLSDRDRPLLGVEDLLPREALGRLLSPSESPLGLLLLLSSGGEEAGGGGGSKALWESLTRPESSIKMHLTSSLSPACQQNGGQENTYMVYTDICHFEEEEKAHTYTRALPRREQPTLRTSSIFSTLSCLISLMWMKPSTPGITSRNAPYAITCLVRTHTFHRESDQKMRCADLPYPFCSLRPFSPAIPDTPAQPLA